MSDFSHRLPIDHIRDGDRMDIVADEGERRAVAARLNVPAIDRLEAHVVLSRDGRIVKCDGRVRAQLVQSCVASGESVPASIDEPFALRFVPALEGTGEEGVELGEDELDVVFHDGQAIDLGDAIADTLGLALDPYPRSANADAVLREAGVASEAEVGPFAALAALKRGMTDET